MKLRLKEDPKEWRKAAWLSLGGVAVFSSLLRWRKHIPTSAWLAVLVVVAIISVAAFIAPRWFRGYYRFSHRLGFNITRGVGLIALTLVFALVITPLGIILRACGQDPLRLKPNSKEESYWKPAPPNSPLDRMF